MFHRGAQGHMPPQGMELCVCVCVCVGVGAKSLPLGPTLCDPIDCSPLGSSVHGILQARVLEWVATYSSRASSRLRYQTCISPVSCTDRWLLYH